MVLKIPCEIYYLPPLCWNKPTRNQNINAILIGPGGATSRKHNMGILTRIIEPNLKSYVTGFYHCKARAAFGMLQAVCLKRGHLGQVLAALSFRQQSLHDLGIFHRVIYRGRAARQQRQGGGALLQCGGSSGLA